MNVTGNFPAHVGPKDLILHLIGKISAQGANFRVLEFHGETVKKMSTSGRLVICNMSVEAGATAGIVPSDHETLRYLRDEAGVTGPINLVLPDPDAHYEREIDIDVSALAPQIACPHTVDNVKPIDQVVGRKVHQIVIGSCTNGRLDDLEAAAKILRGKKVAKDTRMLVFPASGKIYQQALAKGFIADFMSGGCRCHESRMRSLPWHSRGRAGRRGSCPLDDQPQFQGAYGEPDGRSLFVLPCGGGSIGTPRGDHGSTERSMKSMATVVKVLADDISTDVIYPGRFMATVLPSETPQFAFADEKDLNGGLTSGRIPRGSIIVAGNNFGCGSSREQAVSTLKGYDLIIIARSVARIFLQNSINLGLRLMTVPGIEASEGDELDVVEGGVVNRTTGKRFDAVQLPKARQAIIDAGGLVAYTRNRLLATHGR